MDRPHNDHHHETVVPSDGRIQRTARSSELQGPRPAPLRVRKDSHKIKKPPVAPPPPPSHKYLPPPSPVIIYAVSPEVIHTSPGDFMSLVQRLTGPDDNNNVTSRYPNKAGLVRPAPLSPAARFAAIERTATDKRVPGFRGKGGGGTARVGVGGGDLDTMIDNIIGGCFSNINNNSNGYDEVPGGGGSSILSPGPGSLRPVSPVLFPRLGDPSALMSLFHQQQQQQLLQYDHHHHHHRHHHQQQEVDHQQQDGGGNFVIPSPLSATTPSFLSPNPMLSPSTIEFLNNLLGR